MVAEVRVEEVEEASGAGVVVVAVDVETREHKEVRLSVVASTVPDILDPARLCCVANLRRRLLLKSILALALQLYQQGELWAAKHTVQLLRFWVEQARQLACDLAPDVQLCLAAALQVSVVSPPDALRGVLF